MTELCRNLWAKSDPHHPLWCHLLDTAAVARALIARFGLIEGLLNGWIEYLVGCHDVGKADRWFQNKDPQLADRLVGLSLPEWRADALDCHKKFRHEARSREWLQNHLWTQHDWDEDCANVVGSAIVGHHGDWSPKNRYLEKSFADTPQWQMLRDELATMLWETIEPQPCALESFPHASSAGTKLAAYVVLSDWMASNHELFYYHNLSTECEPAEYFAAACERANRVVAQMQLDAPAPVHEAAPPLWGEVWPERRHNPRPLQSALEKRRHELPAGLALIEAPMGEGKTEAAIYLAMVWAAGIASRGLYFALPTQATANSMHKRYDTFLKHWNPDRRARLMHGGAWLRSPSEDEERDETAEKLEYLPELLGGDNPTDNKVATRQARQARDWFRPMRRALLSSEGVGTVDQALLCALRVKFGPLRLLGLSQKTLLVDEVHAYDEFMGVLLEHLLKWCRALDINVILLSATLSQAQKLALCRAYGGPNADLSALTKANAKKAPYPLLSFVPREGVPFSFAVEADASRKRTIHLQHKDGLLDDHTATARLAVQTIADGGCACVLANTVKAAQDIFRVLKQLQREGKVHKDCDLSLFHARFRTEERTRIEDEVVAKFGPDAGTNGNPPRPTCAILVATQVVEQSLDVDFDFLLSQLAPVDLLLQRTGRLWRHERGPRVMDAPTLTILAPASNKLEFGASGKVYAPEILLRSLALCHDAAEWNSPADFRPLIERCYDRAEELGNFAMQTGFEEQLESAQSKRDDEIRAAQGDARIHLWLEPRADSFEPAANGVNEGEEEGGDQPKFLVAQTRRGDTSQAILALRKPEHYELAERDKTNAAQPRKEQRSPPHDKLVEIFNQKAGVPKWWFRDVEPLEGFGELHEGQSFLRGHVLLPLREIDGVYQWQGRNSNGEFAIIDHPELGLLLQSLNAPESCEAQEEADAGFTAS